MTCIHTHTKIYVYTYIYIYTHIEYVRWCHWFLARPWPQLPIIMLLTLFGLCAPLLQGERFSKQNSLASCFARTAPVLPIRSDYRGYMRVCDIISGRWHPNSTEAGSRNRLWAALSTCADAKVIRTCS